MEFKSENGKYYIDGKETFRATFFRRKKEYQESQKKYQESIKEVSKVEKVQKEHKEKRNLNEEKELIKFKWLLDNMKDEYLLYFKAEARKTYLKNSTIRNTKALQRDLNTTKNEFNRVRKIIKL